MRTSTSERRTNRIPASYWTDARGAEIVEMSLVLPILLTLLLGIIWMSRAYNIYETITQAAREGVRYAVLPSCASCGNTYVDTYATAGSCLANPTNVFTNKVSPVLTASNLDPTKLQNYCQQAVVLDPNENGSVQQCGVSISFTYPFQLVIPFTPLNLTTVNIKTQAQMRMENQSVNSGTGNPQCP